MKAHILDDDALAAIPPQVLSAFAREIGFSWKKLFGKHADVYASEKYGEIVLPRTTQISDYTDVTSKFISFISQIEERDELEIYRDLVVGGQDVIRIRAYGGDNDGSIALDAGVKIVECAREMLLAVACATRSPQRVYRAGANRDASEYMNKVRLGQTEHGSFVITMLSPVPPSLQLSLLPNEWEQIDEAPVERRITRQLIDALEASKSAIEGAVAGVPDSFELAVKKGVSANFCEAIAGLAEKSGKLDISLTWAKTRPAPIRTSKVRFTRDDAEVLFEAARTFRRKEPRPDVSLSGWVVKCARSQDDSFGTITLKTVVDEKFQSVIVFLDGANYAAAVNAHKNQTPILINGDIERVGARWHITGGSVTTITGDEDDIET